MDKTKGNAKTLKKNFAGGRTVPSFKVPLSSQC